MPISETTDSLPTSWPDWVQITVKPGDDGQPTADDVWAEQYAGLCHSCSGTAEGDRAAVIRWAQGHFECDPPPAPAPILQLPGEAVGRIEDLPRNPDGTVTIPTAGNWTLGEPS
jgi:hypothetical protein